MLDAINLLLDLRRHLFVRVADADGDDAAQKVEVLLPVYVPHVLVLRMIDHQRVFVVGGDAVEKVFLLFANDFVFGHGVLRSSQFTVDSNPGVRLLSYGQQALDRYVLVDILPMDANSFSNKPPVPLLFTCSGPKPRKPFERSRDFASVREDNVQGVW